MGWELIILFVCSCLLLPPSSMKLKLLPLIGPLMPLGYESFGTNVIIYFMTFNRASHGLSSTQPLIDKSMSLLIDFTSHYPLLSGKTTITTVVNRRGGNSCKRV